MGVLQVLSGINEVSDAGTLCSSCSLCSEREVSIPDTSYRIKFYILILRLATV